MIGQSQPVVRNVRQEEVVLARLRIGHTRITHSSILLKEPFAHKNSETVYFTSIFSTPSYSDIVPIDNFDLTFFYFYFVFEVFDTIQF